MTTEPTDRPTSITTLIFLVVLMAGATLVAFTSPTGPLIWCIGMILGFFLGVCAAIEFQIDREREASSHD